MRPFSALLLLPLSALPLAADAALQRVNLGIYGGQVMDVTAFPDGTDSEVLIAVDSQKGVYRWNAATSRWRSVTHPAIVGPARHVEASLASGYADDVYAIIDTATGGEVYASDSGGSIGSWATLATAINEPSVLLAHASGLYVGTRDGKVYRSTGGVADPFDLVYSATTTGLEVSSLSAVARGLSSTSITPLRGLPLPSAALAPAIARPTRSSSAGRMGESAFISCGLQGPSHGTGCGCPQLPATRRGMARGPRWGTGDPAGGRSPGIKSPKRKEFQRWVPVGRSCPRGPPGGREGGAPVP